MGGWGWREPACTTGPPSGPDCTVGPDRAPLAPSGPDQGAIALSLLELLIKLEGGILSKIGGEVGPGRVPRGFWEGVVLSGYCLSLLREVGGFGWNGRRADVERCWGEKSWWTEPGQSDAGEVDARSAWMGLE